MFGRSRDSIAKARQRRHGQRGVTALEFALVAPTAILVLFFSIEMGIMMMADATLGRVATAIARQGQLNTMGGASCTSRVRAMLASGVSSWVFDPDNIEVTRLDTYEPDDFGPPVPTEPASTSMCSEGGPGAIMVYQLGFKSTGFSGVLSWLDVDFLRFQRTIILQNEP